MEFDKEKIIAEIILKVRFGTVTGREKRLVEEWLAETEEHRRLYEKIISGKSVVEHLNKQSEINANLDVRRVVNQVNRQIRAKRVRARNKFIAWGSLVGAACLVGVILGSLFLAKSDPGIPVTMAENVPGLPSVDKVMLILPTGESIGLTHRVSDSIRVGQTTIVRKDNQITYEADPDTIPVATREEYHRMVTGVGGEYSLILSDGTRVWLNAETELEFPSHFVKQERVVRLRGEAYFEVMPDATRPFLVQAKDIETRVLGTSFNIKAYENEECVFTTLLAGKVEVTATGEGKEPVVLTPGMQSVWQKQTGAMMVKEVAVEKFIAWKQGKFVFDNEDISVVTRLLERWYGVTFIYKTRDRQHTFSGCLSKDESLASILETLTFTGGPRFRVEKNLVYIMDKN